MKQEKENPKKSDFKEKSTHEIEGIVYKVKSYFPEQGNCLYTTIKSAIKSVSMPPV